MNFLRFLLPLLFVAPAVMAQTTTWRAANNPHVVQGVYTVPAGQTLVLEPGVRVEIRADSRLEVAGHLSANGTAPDRITFTGASNYSSALVVSGTSELKFADIQMKTVPAPNGVLTFADCRFSAWGLVENSQALPYEGARAAFLQFDRCEFIGDDPYFPASLYVSECTVAIRASTFRDGSWASVAPGYLYIDRLTSDRSRQYGFKFGADADLFIDNVSVTNASEGGLALSGDTRNGSNVLLGPNNTLQNNAFPVHLTLAGLHKESAIPLTGNRDNVIHVSGSAGNGGYWPKFALPYRVDNLTVVNQLRIQPGARIKMMPRAGITDIGSGDGMRAFGSEAEPIVFERWDPAIAWWQMYAERSKGGRLRHVIVDGSSQGVNGGEWRVENAIFRNNGVATNGGAIVSGSQYLTNEIGHYTGGRLNHITNPNSFEGNVIGVRHSDDARNNWWGSSTGPTTPSNRKGTGDRIEYDTTPYSPFLTARPDHANSPPEVRLLRPSFQQDPGSRITLRWESSDDGRVASHKVLFSPLGNLASQYQTVATLPADQRTYEWTVPAIGFQVAGADAWIKVVAVDETGKEGFDEWEIVVPTNTTSGQVTFNIAPGQVFEPGQMPAGLVNAQPDPNSTLVERYLEIVGAETRKTYANGMPFLSTDTARIVIAYGDTSNRRKYWYSPFFAIRPKAALGDAAPAVALVSPQAGAGFAPGSVVPITWTATDDEGFRGFDIVASFDDARTWQPIAANLPASARSFDWQTAPGSGFANVRVMVIAKDWRFQTSSAGRDRVFSTNSNTTSATAASLTLLPTTIATGGSSTATVTLSRPAPAGGTLVTLGHDGQVFLTMPPNITIPANTSTGTFTINTTQNAVSHTFQISASAGGVTRTAPLTVTLALTDLTLPETANSGTPIEGSVTLSGPAPSGGAIVYLRSANPDIVTVPGSVTVAAGATSANFTATAKSVTSQSSSVITGEHAGTTQSATLTVMPPPAPFDAWRAEHFPNDMNNLAVSGPTADPDNDGMANLLESKLALSPRTPDASPQAVVENGRLTMTFKVSKAASDIALEVHVGSEPSALSSSNPAEVTQAILAEDAQTQTIKATDTSASANAPRRFMRLKATHQQ